MDLRKSLLTSYQEFPAPKFLVLIGSDIALLLRPVEEGEVEDGGCGDGWRVGSLDDFVMADRFP